MIDVGSGPPLVLVPGIQGRWEWMRPTVEALAGRCRVLTTSLAGDPGSEWAIDPARGFDSLVDQIDWVRHRAGLARVAVCGVSYGGYVALRYAATRPEHVSALVMVSTPGPGWRPTRRQRRYVRWPRLLAPLFAVNAPLRLAPEIAVAHPRWHARVRFAATHAARVLAALMSPSRMAERIRLAERMDFAADCAAVCAPTLVVTGERQLDRVVPADTTREYVQAIRGARAATIERTGHIGLVTRPDEFARIVGDFVEEKTQAVQATSRRSGTGS